MKKILPVAVLLVTAALSPHFAYAKWVWTPETGWFRAETIPRATPQEALRRGKELYDSGEFKKAQIELQNFIRFFAGHDLQEEAIFLAANATFAAGDIWKAHQHILAYWKVYPKGLYASQLVELDYEVAMKLLGGNWGRVYGIPLLPGGVTGRGLLEQLLERSPYHPLADDAQLAIGNFYLERDYYPQARMAYEALLIRYPKRETAEEARFMLALATILDSQGLEYDAAVLQDGAGELQYFTALFPQSERAPEASVLLTRTVTALGRKDLRVAIYYLKVGHRDAAAHYLRFAEARYRGTQLGDVAFELLDAIESGQTKRQVMRSAKRLDRKLYEGRHRSENFEKDLEKLGL